MTIHPYDDIEAFVLGDLSESAAQAILEHADRCPSCAVLLSDAMRVANALESSATRPLSAPIVMRAPTTSANQASAKRMRSMLYAASIAAAVFLLLWVGTLGRIKQTPTFDVPIGLLVHSHFIHHALHGPHGNVKILQALDGSWLYLVADNLGANSDYTLVETTGGQRREVGQFRTNAAGQAASHWQQEPTKVESLEVTSSQGSLQPLVWP